MERLIRQITDQLVSRLPENENYYRVQNLEEYGFPTFLIRRIYIELKWNLDESMVLPKTDWANTQSEAVQQSWQRFLSAIHAEVQLPASYARAVIETAVADVAEILVQPRKNIPEIIFGGEDVLSVQELTERMELLVVYPHFANVLMAYLERKNKDELERERCKKIVAQVDEKITHQYTPLQWAQMLDPLFTLQKDTIDTNVFRLFFEDKKRARVAREFDLMNSSITRAEFIEVLSSPDLLNYEGYEPDQSELFTEGEQDEESEHTVDFEESSEEEQQEQINETEETQSGAIDDDSSEREEITDGKKESGREDDEVSVEVKDESEVTEEENGDIPESTQQIEQEKQAIETQDEESESSEDEQSSSLNDQFVGDESEQSPEEEESETEISKAEDDEGPESAIWQRFMDDDDENQNSEEGFIDEPVIDLTGGDDDGIKKENLEEELQDQRAYFVDELFGGSEEVYEESLREISREDSWKEASKLIEKNIFKRNMVDLYSEPAVDFTDRLQTYFLNKQNNN